MTVLVGGLRVLGANSGGSQVGVLTDKSGTLTKVYAADDAKEQFASDFVAAWTKVMNLDRFDLN